MLEQTHIVVHAKEKSSVMVTRFKGKKIKNSKKKYKNVLIMLWQFWRIRGKKTTKIFNNFFISFYFCYSSFVSTSGSLFFCFTVPTGFGPAYTLGVYAEMDPGERGLPLKRIPNQTLVTGYHLYPLCNCYKKCFLGKIEANKTNLYL